MKKLFDEAISAVNGDIYYRKIFDGKGAAAPSLNRKVTNVFVFSPSQNNELFVYDQFFCGIDFQGAATPIANIGINVYRRPKTAADLVDSTVPDIPQSIPIGFDQTAGIVAKWTQEPYGLCKNGQTIQICFQLKNVAEDFPGRITLQFRQRRIPILG